MQFTESSYLRYSLSKYFIICNFDQYLDLHMLIKDESEELFWYD